MIDKIVCLLRKYREMIAYLVVGVMTTVFVWGVCWVCEHFFLDPQVSWQNSIINTIGWIAGVCFAYPLNRKPAYVFGIYGVCRLTSVNVDIGSGHNDDLCECYWSGVLGVKNIHCSGCCNDGKLHIQQNACVQG